MKDATILAVRSPLATSTTDLGQKSKKIVKGHEQTSQNSGKALTMGILKRILGGTPPTRGCNAQQKNQGSKDSAYIIY